MDAPTLRQFKLQSDQGDTICKAKCASVRDAVRAFAKALSSKRHSAHVRVGAKVHVSEAAATRKKPFSYIVQRDAAGSVKLKATNVKATNVKATNVKAANVNATNVSSPTRGGNRESLNGRSSVDRFNGRSSVDHLDIRSSVDRLDIRSSADRFDGRSSVDHLNVRSSADRFDGRSSVDRFDVKGLVQNIFQGIIQREQQAEDLARLIDQNVAQLKINLDKIVLKAPDVELNRFPDGTRLAQPFPNCKFAVITYWWGKGNYNKNFSTKCIKNYPLWDAPNAQVPNDNAARQRFQRHGNLTPDGKTYDKMMQDWCQTCAEQGCNFIAHEISDLAIPKGYQVAINAKPLFIKKALEVARSNGLKGVLYIDGDMTVNQFPHIFNMDNVDFMARGWDMDPRSSEGYLDEVYEFDPWTFQTSGGIMYFADTPGAHAILDGWIRANNRPVHSGKADDRIISLIWNALGYSIPYNIVCLPIEYLWLTDIYGTRDGRNKRVKTTITKSINGKRTPIIVDSGFVAEGDAGPVMIEHPACLTEEEQARKQGAADDRTTILYDELVESRIVDHSVQTRGEDDLFTFYNFIYFYGCHPQAEASFRRYGAWCDSRCFYNCPSSEFYRHHNPVALENLRSVLNDPGITNLTEVNIKKVMELPPRPLAVPGNSKVTILHTKPKTHVVFESPQAVQHILSALVNGKYVVYLPTAVTLNKKKDELRAAAIDSLQEATNANTEFAAYIRSKDGEEARDGKLHDYAPEFHADKPMIFSPHSVTLRHLLLMCKSIAKDTTGEQRHKFALQGGRLGDGSLNAVFNSSYIFMTRIRCSFIEV